MKAAAVPTRMDIGSASIAYRVFGEGRIDTVVEGCLGSCSAEWWDICERLSSERTILAYDRAGYGESSVSSLSRTPENIASELESLLGKLDTEERMILLGHSQGGLYAELYALRNPNRVRGLLLLDPLSWEDSVFRERLTPDEFKKSGVDKTASYRIGKLVAGLGLGFLFKGAIKRAPPFYYGAFSEKAEAYIMRSSMKRSQHETSLEEYRLSHAEENLRAFEGADGALDIPITLVAHSPRIMIEEIEYFGNAGHELAAKIDGIWQEIMEGTMRLSTNRRKTIAENSGHYIHLTDFDLVRAELAGLAAR